MKKTHTHHIIPKHMGGSDDDDNKIELTVEEHAEAHRVLYEKHGKREDWIAWKTLSKQIGKEELWLERSSLGGKKMKGYKKSKTHIENLSIAQTGKKQTEETKKKISESQRGNKNFDITKGDTAQNHRNGMLKYWAKRKAKEKELMGL